MTQLVAAIDFGTTYSGWAYSFRYEFQNDPTNCHVRKWSSGSMVSGKCPTCVLIEPDGKTFHSFGYDAENKYAQLAMDNEHLSWYFFRRFKLQLVSQQGIQRGTMVKEENGKELGAKWVLSQAIKYLKDNLIKEMNGRVASNNVTWVLTVPAIWNDAAKLFMREAAQDAGIEGNHLTIALEPEAASIHCCHIPIEKSGPEQIGLSVFAPGKRYLVLDAGGGTVDVTVHEVVTGGSIKELHKASKGALGGTKVDDEFLEFLVEITDIGTHPRKKVMDEFKYKHAEDYIELIQDFEIKKRQIGREDNNKVTFKTPLELLKLIQPSGQNTLNETIKSTKYANDVKLYGDKLRVKKTVAEGFFKATMRSITDLVKDMIGDPKCKDIDTILMVGGFSESLLLQQEIKRNFPGTQIIIPDEAGLAVLKGAVIFGHNPSTIISRVSKFTYGTDVNPEFDMSKHDLDKMYVDKEGILRCKDVFSVLVRCGDDLVVGEANTEQIYSTLYTGQTEMGMNIYASPYKNPEYIDDQDCDIIKTFSLSVSGKGKSKVRVNMLFGGTEHTVQCEEIETGKQTPFKVDYCF